MEIDESEVDFVLEEFLTSKAFSLAFCRPVILMSPSCTVCTVFHFHKQQGLYQTQKQTGLDLTG